MSSWCWYAFIAYLLAGLIIFPLSKRFPKHFGPARELMTCLTLFTSGSVIVTLIVWVLWFPVMLFSIFIPSNTLEHKTQLGSASFPKEGPELIGLEAICLTDLKPSGKIEIDGKFHDATCANDFLSKGSKVKLTKRQGYYWVVEKIV